MHKKLGERLLLAKKKGRKKIKQKTPKNSVEEIDIERQIPYDLTCKRNLMNKNKLMSKIEPEAWKHGTV